MKIYSYLHSGKPVVATELSTHTQVMDSSIAFLGSPTPEGYGQALLSAISSSALRVKIGAAARAYAEQRYTFEIFSRRLTDIYSRIGEQLVPRAPKTVSVAEP